MDLVGDTANTISPRADLTPVACVDEGGGRGPLLPPVMQPWGKSMNDEPVGMAAQQVRWICQLCSQMNTFCIVTFDQRPVVQIKSTFSWEPLGQMLTSS